MPSKMKLLSQVALGIFLLLETQGMMASPSPTEQPNAPALPVAMPIERYKTMIEHPPFAVASQAAAPQPVVDMPGFAKDLVLTGAVRLNSGEYISFATRDQSQRFGLKTGETTSAGIAVVSVAWSDAVGKTKVTLKRGNEFGVISFDEAVARATTTPGEGGMQVPTPNAQPVMPPGVTPPIMTPNTNANPGNPLPAVPVRRRLIRTAPPSS